MDWKDEYSLGIKEIDDQHKSILLGFSAIEDAIKLGAGWSSIHFSIVELKAVARMHFSFEEALMRLYGFAQSSDHSCEHEYFFARMEEIEHRSLRNSLGTEILEFLNGWLAMHILGVDRDYALHILSGASVVRSGGPHLKEGFAA